MSANKQSQLVTVVYYEEASLVMMHETKNFNVGLGGRIVLPETYKAGKSIIAVCEGKINFLNKIGDRVLPQDMADVAGNAEFAFH